jgi:hypothetical protein
MGREYWSLAGPFGIPIRVGIRITQFILGVVVLGLVASDFSASGNKTNHIYAVVVTVISILTDITHCIATVKHGAWFLLDFCIGILWAALAGVTGMVVFKDGTREKMLSDEPLEGRRVTLFTAIAALSLISMCFWLLSCLHGCAWCCAQRRDKAKDGVELMERGGSGELNG